MASSSESYFYIVPAFTVTCVTVPAGQPDAFIHLPGTSPHHTIQQGAHVVFSHGSHWQDIPGSAIHSGTTYFVTQVQRLQDGTQSIKVSRHYNGTWNGTLLPA